MRAPQEAPTTRGLVAAAVALVLLIAAGVWWFAVRPGQRAAQVAHDVAAGFASGVLDDALFTAPDAGALTEIYAGMGDLRPTVAVQELESRPDGTLRAHLAWSWVIHEGKPAWEYATAIDLRRGEPGQAVAPAAFGDWRAVYAPEAVAPGLQPGEHLRATRLAPVRGPILGQRDEPLAWNQPALRVGIDKTLTDAATAEASAAQIAGLLGLDAERFVAQVRGAGPRAFVEARVLRALVPAEAELARAAQRWIGVRALETTRPLGRTATFARPLLGAVGEATAEQVDASGGTIRGGDLVGRGGLQEARNHVLGGTTGFVVEAVGEGVPPPARELFRVDALDGAAVRTTIDVGVQEAAEAVLADAAATPGGPTGASALVAIRPSDGAVLAAASGPGSAGHSTATLGQFAPGSTFKIVTALAMLRAGATPDALVPCTDGLTVDGYRFDNWAGYPAAALGDVPLRTAFAWSCNSAFLAQAATLTPEQVADAAASLGLTGEKNLVVGSFSGAVPAEGTDVERAAALIGQGRVLASPLGMATVAASVAAGHTVDPVLVEEPGRTSAATPLTQAEADALASLMGAAVTDGTAAELGGIAAAHPGVRVLAKTGTASWGSPVRHHGWVVVVAGDLAVAVFCEDAPGGSSDALAIARAFLA
ncbi:penicillin-binding transpeptidase domain-containing protein [Propioniciclava soli]|uniref:Beta-lactamase n=1 Tax=Propioniciclava soli TaxID=2775081 RepID=A0ABZ3CBT3_9ACTN